MARVKAPKPVDLMSDFHDNPTPSPSLNAERRHSAWSTPADMGVDTQQPDESSSRPSAPTTAAPSVSSHRASGNTGRKSSRVLNCENCREKKMRCDRTNPCSPCALRNVECKWAVEPPDASSAPSPLRQNTGEIAKLRREVKLLTTQLGLSAHDLGLLEQEADDFVRSEEPQFGSASPPFSRSGSASTLAPSHSPKPIPLATHKRKHQPAAKPAPKPAPRAASPPPPPPPPRATVVKSQSLATRYYKRGYSVATTSSWEHHHAQQAEYGLHDPRAPPRFAPNPSATWAAAPPGPQQRFGNSPSSTWSNGPPQSGILPAEDIPRGGDLTVRPVYGQPDYNSRPLPPRGYGAPPSSYRHPQQPYEYHVPDVRPPHEYHASDVRSTNSPQDAAPPAYPPYYYPQVPPPPQGPQQYGVGGGPYPQAPPLTASYSTSPPIPRQYAAPTPHRLSSAPVFRTSLPPGGAQEGEGLDGGDEEDAEGEEDDEPEGEQQQTEEVVDLPPIRRASGQGVGEVGSGREAVELPSIRNWFGAGGAGEGGGDGAGDVDMGEGVAAEVLSGIAEGRGMGME